MAQSWREICERVDPDLDMRAIVYEFSDGSKFRDGNMPSEMTAPAGEAFVIDENGYYVIDENGDYVTA